MDVHSRLAESIQQVWDELPALFGSDWPRLSRRLLRLVGQLGSGPPNSTKAVRAISEIFARHPPAQSRLMQSLDLRCKKRRPAKPGRRECLAKHPHSPPRPPWQGTRNHGGLTLETLFSELQKEEGSWIKARVNSAGTRQQRVVILKPFGRGKTHVASGRFGASARAAAPRPAAKAAAPRTRAPRSSRVTGDTPSTRAGAKASRGPRAPDSRSGTRDLKPSKRRDGPESATLTRYTDILCPRRVWIGAPRFAVVVRLTVERPKWSAAVASLEVKKEVPVVVRLQAPGFEPIGPTSREIAVKEEGDSEAVVFELRPKAPGASLLTVDFSQGGDPVGTATVPVEVTTFEVSEDAEHAAPRTIRSDPELRPPDIILRISLLESPPALSFELIRDGGVSSRSFAPVRLSGSPETAARELYSTIAQLVDRKDPVLNLELNKLSVIPVEEVDDHIREIGWNLWDQLIPEELRRIYAENRADWKGQTLLVFSDEPHIPWELVWPYDENGAWEDDGPWCITMKMTRWLRKDAQGNGNETPLGQLNLRNLAVVAPRYRILKDLPAAREERARLLKLAVSHKIQDVSPTPESRGVKKLLETGGYDWFHAAAHGSFHPGMPDGVSALWLENDSSLTPAAIGGAKIVGHLRRRRPAFVFNACQTGRQAFALTGIGGWANRLVRAGAGLFIGPHWEVRDEGALKFAEAFYAALLDGAPVAEAVHAARLAARASGDPTWLAYSVYAHPNAVVKVGPADPPGSKKTQA